jgi:5-formyltetrahydrofolate cyclo-ligase
MTEEHDAPPSLDEVLAHKVKAELRKRLRGLRRTSTVEACRQRSEKIVAALLSRDEIARAKSVALFWPIEEKREVDLRTLGDALSARGVRIAYPTIDQDSRLMTFRFAEHAEHGPLLEERGMGFCEPHPDAEEASALDVIVVPAIGVDPQGHRIGYGAGYYDRTLPRFCPPAIAIAVAFDYQLVMEVPKGPHDVAVNVVVTDARVLDIGTEDAR